MNTEGIRQRRNVAKVIRELDAFPKVPDTYTESTASGGTVSILVFLIISLLVISEFIYYRSTEIKYKYEVDKNADHPLRINFDITVAMDCDDLGADVLDVSGGSLNTDSMRMQPTHFAMTSNQQAWFNAFRSVRKTSEGYRSVNKMSDMDLIFGDVLPTYMPAAEEEELKDKDTDACRIYGSVNVNKVAGNFHITAGKSIPHPRGHAHLSALVSELNYNFSHRIDLLSFGEPHAGIINPLDGDLLTTPNGYHMYQYYIKIVPTTINTFKQKLTTNQYSVTQRSRKVDGTSRGVPGIFFKYDLNSIALCVNEERRSFGDFCIRLCGIIGGVFATSGMLHNVIGALADFILCKVREQRKPQTFSSEHRPTTLLPQEPVVVMPQPVVQ